MFAVCATIAAIMSIIIEEDLRRINFSKQNVQMQAYRDEDLKIFEEDVTDEINKYENEEE